MFYKKDKVYRYLDAEYYVDENLKKNYNPEKLDRNYSDFRNFRYIPIFCNIRVYFFYSEKLENLDYSEIFSDKYQVDNYSFYDDSSMPPAAQLRETIYSLYKKNDFNYRKHLSPGFDNNLAFGRIQYILPTNQTLTIRCKIPESSSHVLPHDFTVFGNEISFPLIDTFTKAIPQSQINLETITDYSVIHNLYKEIFRSVCTTVPKYPIKFGELPHNLKSFVSNNENKFPKLPIISFFNKDDFRLIDISPYDEFHNSFSYERDVQKH